MWLAFQAEMGCLRPKEGLQGKVPGLRQHRQATCHWHKPARGKRDQGRKYILFMRFLHRKAILVKTGRLGKVSQE